MKESEIIKDFSDRLVDIVNKVRLLGIDFSDSKIVQKILVTVPKKFEATISSIENSKDVSSITLAELLNALQAQEQRRLMRQEGSVEGAFQAISQNNMYKKEKQSNIHYLSNSYKRISCLRPTFELYRHIFLICELSYVKWKWELENVLVFEFECVYQCSFDWFI
ncbi:hypothetical protein F0562_010352 [Nyssa sinensis]|uniref:Uncharacterized protein n=1 Tax=Nyssa sinensis TaxID=561372 RepID=A0A5J5A0W0_9ASTE|nr:hypothetical protein F0562_010352 [Nyssa sinensis]